MKEDMKKSRYNVLLQAEDGKELAFNSMSCALAEVDDDFLFLIENIEHLKESELSEYQKKLIEKMKEGSYIVNKKVDELSQIKLLHNKGRYNNCSLGLTIAPTLSCNFKCPYCYETPNNIMMLPEVQDNLIKAIEKYAENIRHLNITWYGGEPLLGKEVIWKLSEQMISLCESKNITYSAYMITNGYLINQDVIDNMKKYKISGCQITIDGPPEIHNKRRILKNSGETFDKIINNVKLLVQNDCNVGIRINIDKTNVSDVERLIKIFKKVGIDNASINFGQVTAYTEACASVSSQCFTNEEFASSTLELQKMLHRYNIKASGYPYYPAIKANYCGADQINAYVIDPEGYMYKCWNSVGDVSQSVGNICDMDTISGIQMINNIEWFEQGPFNSSKCKECNFLPICMGGCPFMRLKTGKESCEKWIYNFHNLLRYTYEAEDQINSK